MPNLAIYILYKELKDMMFSYVISELKQTHHLQETVDYLFFLFSEFYQILKILYSVLGSTNYLLFLVRSSSKLIDLLL